MKKGFYTIITTFFFIIMIIIVILLAVGLQGKVFGAQRGVDDRLLGYTITREATTTYLSCHGDGMLKEEKLNTSACPLPSLVSGMKIVQYEVPPCEAREWTFGNPASQSLITYAPLLYANGTKCMTRIIISPSDTPR